MKRRLFSLTGIAVLQAVCLTVSVHAQNFTWTGGGGDRLWSNGANWSGGSAPAGSNLTSLTFSGEAPFFDPARNDLPGTFLLNRVDFTGLTGEFYTDGGNLQFLYGAPIAIISQNSAFAASLGGDILVNNDTGNDEMEIVGNGAGAMRFGGLITNKQYIGIYRGANTYTAFDGGLVNSGQLTVGTGTLGLWKGITNTGSISVASNLVFSSNEEYNFEQGSSLSGTAGSTIEFGGGSVNFNGAVPHTVTSAGTVTLIGSDLGGAADFTLDLSGGSFDWRAGGFAGTAAQNATVKLKTGLIEGPSTKTISRSLTLDGGSLSWNGGALDLGATGNLTLNNISVTASALAGDIKASGAANQLTLTASSLRKISGDATVIDIQPTVSADANSSLITDAGGIKFTKGGAFSSSLGAFGTGYLEFTGTTNLEGSANISGGADVLRLTSGNFNVNSNAVTIQSGAVLESGATLGGTATNYTINSGGSAFKWNGGSITGPAGSQVSIIGANLGGSALKTIDTRNVTLSNSKWTGGDILLKDADLTTGLLTVQSDQAINRAGTTGGLTVTNGFVKDTTTGTTTINVPVNLPDGPIRAATGKILLTGGGTATGGVFLAGPGGTVEFGGGNYELNNAFGFGGTGGTGNFLISAGAVRVNTSGANINQSGSLTLAEGGTLGGAANSFDISGTAFRWTGGTVTGPAGSVMNVTAPATISGSATKTIDSRGVSFFNGAWTGGDIALKDAELRVGQMTVQSDQAINRTGTTGVLTVVNGFVKDTTTGTTTINVPVTVASGAMRAATGKILLTGGGAAGGGVFVANPGGTVEFGGGNFELNNAFGFGGTGGTGNFLISAGEVRVNTAGATVNQSANLTLAEGGALGGAAASYAVSGTAFQWTGGTIKGPAGANVNVFAPATLSGSATKTIDTRSVNISSGTWTGGDIALKDAGLTVNSLMVQSDKAINRTGTTGGLTVNSGFQKDITTGTTTINVPVTLQGGSMRAGTGRILLTGGGTAAGGVFVANPAGTVEFGGGNYELNNAFGFGGSGGTGNFLISAGAVRVNTGGANINQSGSLTLAEGGTLGGTAGFYSLGGTGFQWTGGAITGPAGSGVNIFAPTTISGSAVKTIDTRNVSLSNGTWTGGDIALKDANLTVGTLTVQSDKAMNLTGTTGGLTVNGTFVKNTTAGITTINAPVTVQSGTLVAATGKILLTGGGAANGGIFQSTSTGTVEFGSGNYELNNSVGFGGFSGAGNFLISAGEVRVNAGGSTINQAASLTLAGGGALGGTAGFYGLAGTGFQWTGGTITGPAGSGVNIFAPTTISGSAVKTIDTRNVSLSNGTWTGGDINVTGAQLSLGGTTSVQAPNTLGGTGTVVNTGLFHKTTASVTTISAAFTNNAAVLINEGTLRVNSTLDGLGNVIVGAGGALGGTGTIGNVTTVSGKVAPGASPGQLTFTQNATFLAGSTYDFELAAFSDSATGGTPGTDWDMLSGAGTAVITLQLGSQLTLNFDGIQNPDFPNAFWDGVTDRSWLIASSAGGLLDQGMTITNPNWNAGTFSLSNDGTDLRLNFAAVPEPGVLSVIGAGLTALLLPRRRRRDY